MNVCCCVSRPNAADQPLCENCVTECCTVVISTAFAMDVPPVSVNGFSYLQMKWRPPKAGVTGSNPVGRAIKTMVLTGHMVYTLFRRWVSR
jgi:hypothetical protein